MFLRKDADGQPVELYVTERELERLRQVVDASGLSAAENIEVRFGIPFRIMKPIPLSMLDKATDAD